MELKSILGNGHVITAEAVIYGIQGLSGSHQLSIKIRPLESEYSFLPWWVKTVRMCVPVTHCPTGPVSTTFTSPPLTSLNASPPPVAHRETKRPCCPQTSELLSDELGESLITQPHWIQTHTYTTKSNTKEPLIKMLTKEDDHVGKAWDECTRANRQREILRRVRKCLTWPTFSTMRQMHSLLSRRIKVTSGK